MSDKYLFSQGNASFEKGNYQQAISFYYNAIDLNPDNLNYFKSRCISFIKNGNFDQATRDANLIVSKNPELDYGYILLGISNLANNQLDKAEDAFIRANQINPHNMITQNYLGKIQQSRQNGFKSLQLYDPNFQEIFQQYLQDPMSINNFAGNTPMLDALNNYMDRFDRPTTIQYQNVILNQTQNPLAQLLTESKSYFKQNQFEEAIELCQQGVMNCNENTPSSIITSLFQIITSSYIKMNEIDKAVIYCYHFHELSQINGFEITDSVQKNCEYIQIASQNFKDRQERERALSYYSKSQKSDTDMSHFFRGEIKNSIKNNQIEKASEISSLGVSLLPNDPDILYFRAKVNFKLGQIDLCISDCLKSLKIRPAFSKAELLVSSCFLLKNEPKEALFFCRKCLLHDRENKKAVEMTRRIDDLIRFQKEEKMIELLRKRQEKQEAILQQQRENEEKMRKSKDEVCNDNAEIDGKKRRKKNMTKQTKEKEKENLPFNDYPHSQPLPTVRRFNRQADRSPFPSSFQELLNSHQNSEPISNIRLNLPNSQYFSHQPQSSENIVHYDPQNPENMQQNDPINPENMQQFEQNQMNMENIEQAGISQYSQNLDDDNNNNNYDFEPNEENYNNQPDTDQFLIENDPNSTQHEFVYSGHFNQPHSQPSRFSQNRQIQHQFHSPPQGESPFHPNVQRNEKTDSPSTNKHNIHQIQQNFEQQQNFNQSNINQIQQNSNQYEQTNQQNNDETSNFQYPHSQPYSRSNHGQQGQQTGGHSPFPSSFMLFHHSPQFSDPVTRNYNQIGQDQQQNHPQFYQQNQQSENQFQSRRHSQPHNH